MFETTGIEDFYYLDDYTEQTGELVMQLHGLRGDTGGLDAELVITAHGNGYFVAPSASPGCEFIAWYYSVANKCANTFGNYQFAEAAYEGAQALLTAYAADHGVCHYADWRIKAGRLDALTQRRSAEA